MSRHVVGIVVWAVSATVVAAPVPKALKQDDRAVLVGDWEEPPEKRRVWWFKADGTAGGGDLPEASRRGVYRIDPTTTPKQLDWSTDNGKTWQLGVYSLDGDVLKVNMGKDHKAPSPTSLEELAETYAITATRKKN